ncbi:hypothetical protein BESB_077120 [Besnoitia besnoiti]|uniref:Uncharacterized protein n=1 Tax=Besnoitia besnoiti TaxID=94643 RepID=A0A2A9M695_BESBE|nr:hypothetical protein BESB_077120 [Besnoitia besnoiti]PFH33495.1 hypothetical protein BESB_077120 [Besnoitia besnoiti]
MPSQSRLTPSLLAAVFGTRLKPCRSSLPASPIILARPRRGGQSARDFSSEARSSAPRAESEDTAGETARCRDALSCRGSCGSLSPRTSWRRNQEVKRSFRLPGDCGLATPGALRVSALRAAVGGRPWAHTPRQPRQGDRLRGATTSAQRGLGQPSYLSSLSRINRLEGRVASRRDASASPSRALSTPRVCRLPSGVGSPVGRARGSCAFSVPSSSHALSWPLPLGCALSSPESAFAPGGCSAPRLQSCCPLSSVSSPHSAASSSPSASSPSPSAAPDSPQTGSSSSLESSGTGAALGSLFAASSLSALPQIAAAVQCTEQLLTRLELPHAHGPVYTNVILASSLRSSSGTSSASASPQASPGALVAALPPSAGATSGSVSNGGATPLSESASLCAAAQSSPLAARSPPSSADVFSHIELTEDSVRLEFRDTSHPLYQLLTGVKLVTEAPGFPRELLLLHNLVKPAGDAQQRETSPADSAHEEKEEKLGEKDEEEEEEHLWHAADDQLFWLRPRAAPPQGVREGDACSHAGPSSASASAASASLSAPLSAPSQASGGCAPRVFDVTARRVEHPGAAAWEAGRSLVRDVFNFTSCGAGATVILDRARFTERLRAVKAALTEKQKHAEEGLAEKGLGAERPNSTAENGTEPRSEAS